MKNRIIYILAITGLLWSCDLDQIPDGQLIAGESAIIDANSAENALNGAYRSLVGDWY